MMRSTVTAIAALLLSAAILLAGNGLQSTLVAVRANIEGFSLSAIGFLTAAYFAGFIGGCLRAPTMVAQVGHIRAFAALAALAAAAALLFALSTNVWLWFFLRGLTGFCFAGLYMIIESWINDRADNQNRGQVLSIYRIVDLSAITVGQFLLTAADPAGFILFSVVGIFIALAIVPVSLTKATAPSPLVQSKLDLGKLLRVSPLAVAGSFGVGLASGAFWGIGPVFVQQLGYGTGLIATFMSTAIIAGALAQWPIGFLSDVMDRRRVLVAVSGLASLGGLFLFAFAGMSSVLLLIGAGIYGCFVMPMFGLSAAHANDHAERHEFVAVSSGLLLVFGIGSVAGPLIAPIMMNAIGPSALFAYTAAVHALLFGFGLYRLSARAGIPLSDQEDYVSVPRTTPGVFEFDPRGTDPESGPAPTATAHAEEADTPAT